MGSPGMKQEISTPLQSVSEGPQILVETLAAYISSNVYVLVSPFRVSYNSFVSEYEVQPVSKYVNCLQILLMICKFTLLWEFVLKKYYLGTPSSLSGSAVSELLNETAHMIWLAYNTATKICFWTCAEDIVATLNCYIGILKRHNFCQRPKWSKWITYGLVVLFHLPMVLYAVLQHQFIGGFRPTETNSTENWIGSVNAILLVGLIHESSVTAFSNTYMLLMSLVLLASAKLVAPPFMSKPKVFARIRAHIRLKTWISRSSGVTISVACLGNLVYFMQMLNYFTKADILHKIELIYFVLLQSACLICGVLSGSITSRAYESYTEKESLSSGDDTFLRRMSAEATLVSHAILTDGVSLKSRAFTTTYSLLGNMLGIVITYSIAFIQLQG